MFSHLRHLVATALVLWSVCEGSLKPRFSIAVRPNVTFEDCIHICKSSGGYLATPTSAGENAIVTALLNTTGNPVDSPLGGSRQYDGVNFRWVTGPLGKLDNGHGAIFYRGITSTGKCAVGVQCNWYTMEPNNYGGNEPILHVMFTGQWNDMRYDYVFQSCICQFTFALTLSQQVSVTLSHSSSTSNSVSRRSNELSSSLSLSCATKPASATASDHISHSGPTDTFSVHSTTTLSMSKTCTTSRSVMSHTLELSFSITWHSPSVTTMSPSWTLSASPVNVTHSISASSTDRRRESSSATCQECSASSSATRSVTPIVLVCAPAVSPTYLLNASMITVSGTAALEAAPGGNLSLQIAYSESLPETSRMRFALRGLQRPESIVGAYLNGALNVGISEAFEPILGTTIIALHLPRSAPAVVQSTPYTAQQLSIALWYRCNFFDLFPTQLNLTVDVLPLALPSSTSAVSTPATSAVGLSSVSAGVTSPGMMSRLSAASEMLQCSDTLTAVERVSHNGLVAVSVAGADDPLADAVNTVVGNVAVILSCVLVCCACIVGASCWTGAAMAVPALRLHFPSILFPVFAASLSSSLGAMVDLCANASTPAHIAVVCCAIVVWGSYLVAVVAIAVLPSHLHCELLNHEIASACEVSLLATSVTLLHAIFSPRQRWFAVSEGSPQSGGHVFVDASKVVLRDVRYPWYPLFDTCLTVVCAVVVNAPRSASNSCTLQFAAVIGCMSLQLAVNAALRPFTSLFSVVFGILMVALSTVSVSCQVYLKVNEVISDRIATLATTCALGAVAMSMLRSIVDAVSLGALMLRFVKWTAVNKRVAPPVDEALNANNADCLEVPMECVDTASSTSSDSDAEEVRRLTAASFDVMLQRLCNVATDDPASGDMLNLLIEPKSQASRKGEQSDSLSLELGEGSLLIELHGSSDAWGDNGNEDVFEDLQLGDSMSQSMSRSYRRL